MSVALHRSLERVAIAAMLLGILGMFQPWIFDFFGWGFLLLLFGTIAFTIISNISPRSRDSLKTETAAPEAGYSTDSMLRG